MKNSIRKKVIVLVTSFMFVAMMGLSITTSMNGTDFSLAGIEALAVSGGTGFATCSGECDIVYCEISGHDRNGCIAGGCGSYCTCEGQTEGGQVERRTSDYCGDDPTPPEPCDDEEYDPDCEEDS